MNFTLHTFQTKAVPTWIFWGLCTWLLVGLLNEHHTLAQNSPEVQIISAEFGTGRGSAKCEARIAEIIKDRKAVTTITSEGIKIKNPSGRFRDLLRITYRIDGKDVLDANGKPVVLELKNGEQVNIYQAIVDHAKNFPNQKAPPARRPTPTPSNNQPTPNQPAPPPVTPEPTPGPSIPEKTISVPGKIKQFRTGNDGSILVAHVPEKNALIVYDIVKGEPVHEMPAPEDVVFAASRDKLAIITPSNFQIQRWNLKTFEREATGLIDRDLKVDGAVMGAHGNGPLAILANGTVQLWDLQQLKPLNIRGPILKGEPDTQYEVSVSADGQNFCGWPRRRSRSGYEMMRLDNNSSIIRKTSDDIRMRNAWAFPIPHGDLTLTFGSQALSRDLQVKSTSINGEPQLFPTDDPGIILAVSYRSDQWTDVSLLSATDFSPILSLPQVSAVGKKEVDPDWGRIGPEPCCRYLPNEKLFFYIPMNRDKILVRALDLKRELDAKGGDYLHFTSLAPSTVVLGQAYAYQLQALSNTPVKFALELGPPGMEVSTEGKVTWTAPTLLPPTAIERAIISAKNDAGLEKSHVLEIFFRSTDGREFATKPSSPSGGTTVGDAGTDAIVEGLVYDKTAIELDRNTPIPMDMIPQDSAIALPGIYDYVRLGGNGKFLICRIPTKSMIAIVDLEKLTLVKELAATPNSVFAASRDKLVVIDPTQKTLTRWDLESLRKETEASLDQDWTPTGAVMGCDSDGPLVIWDQQKNQMQYWEIKQLKPIIDRWPHFPTADGHGMVLTLSADGSTLCGFITNGKDSKYQVIRLDQPNSSIQTTFDSPAGLGQWAMPNRHGSMLLATQNRAFHADLSTIVSELSGSPGDLVPTDDPAFIASVRAINEGTCLQATLCTASDQRRVFRLPPFICGKRMQRYDNLIELSFVPRIQVLTQQKIVVCLPYESDQILIRPFDLAAVLRDIGSNHIVVNSSPPAQAMVGSEVKYQIEIAPESKISRFELKSGPSGMSVDAKGLLTWKVDNRPLGGSGAVDIELENEQGLKLPLNFRIDVFRESEPLAKLKPGKNDKLNFYPVGDQYLEVPEPVTAIHPGQDDTTLVLAGQNLAVLDSDGITVKTKAFLNQAYKKIVERDQYYLAISQKSAAIDYLDKKTFEVKRTVNISFNNLTDLALHPNKPIVYVAGTRHGELPHHLFVIVDEKSGKSIDSEEWIGNWIAITPDGKSLLAGYSDSYVKGSRLLINPGRWQIEPEYGDLSWLIRYQVDTDGLPQIESIRDRVGSRGTGIQLSPDGKSVVYTSHLGFPQGAKNLASWSSQDLSKSPVVYLTNNSGSPKMFQFHPRLELAASCGETGAYLFDSETGDSQADRIENATSTSTEKYTGQVYFAADGASLVAETNIARVNYLKRHKLNLSSVQSRKNTAKAARESDARSGETTPKESALKVPLAQLDAFKGGIGEPTTTAQIAKKHLDSVVVIACGEVSGTGFVVGSNGYILTCAHCLPDPEEITVRYRTGKSTQQERSAKLIAIDEKKDIALIKISIEHELPPIRLAFGMPVETGADVAVIGNPASGNAVLDYTMSNGIVSNPFRDIDETAFIQTTAAVNPGSSGGPMFNDQGLVIGMVVLKARIEGAGFAISADEIGRFLIKQLDKNPKTIQLERDWYDNSGQGPLAAVYLGRTRDVIRIKRTEDDKEFELPIDRLSDADRQFVSLLPITEK